MAHLFKFAVCSVLLFGGLTFVSPDFAAERTPVAISDNSPLALRVLTRPHAVLYKDASEANAADSNIPVFKPCFVYTRPGGEAREAGTGWYEVGTDEKGTIAGWIQSSDVFEWKQTMCLAYSHPLNRKPVLMFEDKEKLAAVSGKADTPRADGSGGSDIRKNTEYAKAATAENASAGKTTQDMVIDVVWVMDTTRSMQPYIEELRNTMSGVTKTLTDTPELKGKLAFGIWAYRDSE